MRAAGWALLVLGALVITAVSPQVAAGVAMVLCGAAFLAQ